MGKPYQPQLVSLAGFLNHHQQVSTYKAYTNHNENHQSPGVVVQPFELETQRLMRHVVLRSTLQDLALEVVTEATVGRWRGDRL